ncbi:MAG: hypothetical protein ACTSP2_02550 [Alphaproteobacteria bacterium]
MKRKSAKPKRVPARHNPLAQALADGRYRKRVVKKMTGYKRRPKHVRGPGHDGEGGA